MARYPLGTTHFKPEMIDIIMPLLKEGASIEEIGLELGIGYSTLYTWMEKHPELMEAIKQGREFSKGWWMKQGRISLREKEFNPTTWYMNMKNRFGWRDKHEVDVSVDETTEKVKEAKKYYNKYDKPY
jgi:transposase